MNNAIDENEFEVSVGIHGKAKYNEIYRRASDSIEFWNLNNFNEYTSFYNETYKLDSLLCFNSKGNRFIAALYSYVDRPSKSDELHHFYGELINDSWYFFRGSATLILPRAYYLKDTLHTPTYSQLHNVAMRQFYSSYLVAGKINECLFTYHFEGKGWGDFNNQTEENDWYLKGRRFKTKKEFYEAMHLDKVRGNWAGRDTSKPITSLPPKALP